MSFSSPFPDVEIPDLTLFDYLFGSVAPADLDRPALIDGSRGTSTTYRELVADIERIAGGLVARGLVQGTVVGLLSPNTPSFAAVFHGILRAGGTATTINTLYTPDDIAKQLSSCDAQFLFTVTSLLPQARAAARKVGIGDDHLVLIDGDDNCLTLKELMDDRAELPDAGLDPAAHVAVLPFSSGTTGLPKGVILTHRNLVANVAQVEQRFGMTRDDAVLALLPFFHIYGLTVLVNVALKLRARLVTMPKFDVVEFFQIVQQHKLTYLPIAPPIAVVLAKHPAVERHDLSSVRTVLSGAAALNEETGQAVAKRLGARVLQGYGMSEMSPVSHVIPFDRPDISLSSIGLPVANTVNKLVEPQTGREIEIPVKGMSVPGELWVKGPNVMVGYLDDPDATSATIDADGFLHTGDMAKVDCLGAVYIVDRLKELIKYKGYQVPPAELEALLLSHPMIADAAVIGVSDEESGEEVPKAYVVLQAGAEMTETDVMAFIAERVAAHKKIRAVAFIGAIPKSPSGKILRKDLREQHRNAGAGNAPR
ncbi:MAG TPA: AMP-binding protein [Ensifer sp.]|nr:AMP-binding protein [Ensifer sp.]